MTVWSLYTELEHQNISFSLAVCTFAAYACVNRKHSMQMFELNTYVLAQTSSPFK